MAILAELTETEAVLPLTGAATEAYRLHDIRRDDGVRRSCAPQARYDWRIGSAIAPARSRCGSSRWTWIQR